MNAKNNAGDVVAFCQTVLPGNEAMLIPTSVEGTSTLAVPGTSYWCSTAAQFVLLNRGFGGNTNHFVATTSMLPVSAPVMLAYGVMNPSRVEIGPPMLQEQIPIRVETLLSRLDGTQFSLDVRSLRPHQHLA